MNPLSLYFTLVSMEGLKNNSTNQLGCERGEFVFSSHSKTGECLDSLQASFMPCYIFMHSLSWPQLFVSEFSFLNELLFVTYHALCMYENIMRERASCLDP